MMHILAKVFALVLFLTLSLAAEELDLPKAQSWEAIEVHDTLKWYACGDSFNDTCARLQVPLDYQNTAAGKTWLAIRKIKANKPNDRITRDVIVSPSIPDTSAVDVVRKYKDSLRIKLGEEHNLIAIDSRGMGHSTELDNYSCLTMESAPVCEAGYASTVAVAQDLLRFIEVNAISQGKPPKDEMLSFFGVGYGTVVGSTFAALYPHRVGRMLLDSPIDTEAWYNGTKRTNDNTAVDAIMKKFAQYCSEAKPSECALHEKFPEDVRRRMLSIIDRQETEADKRQMRQKLLKGLASPALWPALATYFDDVEGRRRPGRRAAVTTRQAKAFPKTSIAIQCLDIASGGFVESKSSQPESIWLGPDEPLDCPSTISIPGSQQWDKLVPKFYVATALPVLFIGQSYDPYDPLTSATSMSSHFVGSSVLRSTTLGYSSFGHQKNSCLEQGIRDYFRNQIPMAGTLCRADCEADHTCNPFKY